jgi:hypothetical protein
MSTVFFDITISDMCLLLFWLHSKETTQRLVGMHEWHLVFMVPLAAKTLSMRKELGKSILNSLSQALVHAIITSTDTEIKIKCINMVSHLLP